MATALVSTVTAGSNIGATELTMHIPSSGSDGGVAHRTTRWTATWSVWRSCSLWVMITSGVSPVAAIRALRHATDAPSATTLRSVRPTNSIESASSPSRPSAEIASRRRRRATVTSSSSVAMTAQTTAPRSTSRATVPPAPISMSSGWAPTTTMVGGVRAWSDCLPLVSLRLDSRGRAIGSLRPGPFA